MTHKWSPMIGQADISILDVPDLPAQPLKFAEYTAGTGTDVLVLGYPGAGSFKASMRQIREVTELNGPDIYRENGDSPGIHTDGHVSAGRFQR